jgi:hypothetical protein
MSVLLLVLIIFGPFDGVAQQQSPTPSASDTVRRVETAMPMKVSEVPINDRLTVLLVGVVVFGGFALMLNMKRRKADRLQLAQDAVPYYK